VGRADSRHYRPSTIVYRPSAMSIPQDVLSPYPRPPEKSGNTCLILGLIFGGFGGFVLLCGGCCIGTMFFAFGELERQTRESLTENKVIQEHIGQIKTFEIDWMESIQMSSEGKQDTFVFHATGDKGSGTIVAVVLDAGGDAYVESGTLTMDNGEVYELVEGMESEDAAAAAEAAAEEAMEAAETPDPSSQVDEKFAAKVQAALSSNAVLAERIGDIQSFTYDIVQSTDERGENIFVFHVTGSKGSGKLRAECITVDTKTERVASAELILDNGESVQLIPDKPLE
jgi:hypothetical protein